MRGRGLKRWMVKRGCAVAHNPRGPTELYEAPRGPSRLGCSGWQVGETWPTGSLALNRKEHRALGTWWVWWWLSTWVVRQGWQVEKLRQEKAQRPSDLWWGQSRGQGLGPGPLFSAPLLTPHLRFPLPASQPRAKSPGPQGWSPPQQQPSCAHGWSRPLPLTGRNRGRSHGGPFSSLCL